MRWFPNGHRAACSLRAQVVALLALMAGPAGVPAFAGDSSFFRKQVAPILERHCLSCHGAKTQKSGLSLATAEDALAGGERGPALVPGKAHQSLLLKVLSGGKPKMPRNARPLTAQQVARIRTWIEQGAAWPKDLTLRDRKAAGGPWWSLQPLRRAKLPAV